jgi:hypothetical protein
MRNDKQFIGLPSTESLEDKVAESVLFIGTWLWVLITEADEFKIFGFFCNDRIGR